MKAQAPFPWANQIPQHMYNMQNTIKSIPPYLGYPLPTLQPIPLYYQRNMHCPVNIDEAHCSVVQEPNYHRTSNLSSKNRKKYLDIKEPEYSGEDRNYF